MNMPLSTTALRLAKTCLALPELLKGIARLALVIVLLSSLSPQPASTAFTWTPVAPPNIARDGHTATLLPGGKVLVAGGEMMGNPGSYLDSAAIYDPSANTWTTVAAMNTGRVRHTATLLPNGKVLIVGGQSYGGSDFSLDSVEVYDPNADMWTTVMPLSMARHSHTATLLPSGKVLIAGGTYCDYYYPICWGTTQVEVYDPQANTWTTVAPLHTVRRWGHTTTLLPSGKVLVVGGCQTEDLYLASAEIYDPGANTWTTITPLNTARSDHTATLLPGGKVLVAGGETGTLPYPASYLASAEIYDPSANTWTTAASLTVARAQHTATLLPNGQVLVAGGCFSNNCAIALTSTETYDPSANTWTTSARLYTTHGRHTATLLPSGKVLVVGGHVAEINDLRVSPWTRGAPLNTGRANHTATLLPNGKLLVVGGYFDSGNNRSWLASTELYDPGANTWATVTPLNTGRANHTATLLPNGKLLVVGGYFGSGDNWSELASTELYDPGANTWTTVAPLNTARYAHTATLLPNGAVLAAGGITTGHVAITSTELYDPDANTWTTVAPLNTARFAHTATLLPNGAVLIAGGETTGYVSTTSTELYDLDANNQWC